MSTARQETNEAAARLRYVIEECERIAADPADPRRERASEWLHKLCKPSGSGPSLWVSAVESGPTARPRPSSGNLALATEGRYEGWPERRRR